MLTLYEAPRYPCCARTRSGVAEEELPVDRAATARLLAFPHEEQVVRPYHRLRRSDAELPAVGAART
jgi:hypothetical protein